jgi:tetratricopeptide (TPR) repeat protein
MSIPPLPKLPPASELRKYSSSPPDFISPIVRYHADEEAQNFVYDAWDAESVPQKFALLSQALRIFPFSVDALNAWANLYRVAFDPPEFVKAETTYQMALTSARLLWPNLENQEKIEWGHLEHRPLLRTYHGLGVIQKELGKHREAVEKFQFLLKVIPNDNQGARQILFETLIQMGEYQQAEQVAEKHANGRNSTEAFVHYGFVLIDFLRFKAGECTEMDLQETLARALQHNNYVPLLLLGDLPLPEEPTHVPPGGLEEATSIVLECKPVWERTPGIIEWFRDQRQLGGEKPNDDGEILFQLLQKGNIMVHMKNTNEFLELTSNVELMPGTATPEFGLAPGMKKHNPSKIVALNRAMAYSRDVSFREKFVAFPYDDVIGVHFWKILLTSKVLDEAKKHSCRACYKPATMCCSDCKVVWYCSRDCQRKDWKGYSGIGVPHKSLCPKLQKK